MNGDNDDGAGLKLLTAGYLGIRILAIALVAVAAVLLMENC